MKAKLEDGKIIVSDCYLQRDIVKGIPGSRWNRLEGAWEVPLSIEAVDILRTHMRPGEMDEQVLVEYEKLKEKQSEVTSIKSAEKVEPIEPIPISVKPFQHQVRAFNLGLLNSSFAYLLEQGTGKSLVAAALAARRYQRGEVRKVLIVAPASVLPVWPHEFEAVTVPYEIHVLQGKMEKRTEGLNKFINTDTLHVVVVNYEATWRMIDELIKWRPDMIIADESQRIKNPSAKQSKAVYKIGRAARYRLILTGTPVQNAPLDFFSQYRFLDPAIFGTSFYAFRNRYAVMGGYGGYEVIRYQNLDELTRKAHSIAYRVTKAEALDLPEQIDEYRYCALEPKAKRVYEEIRKQSYAEFQDGEVTVTNALTRLLRLQQITGGFVNTDEGVHEQVSNAKLEVLKETIEDTIDAGKKVVIFARFVDEIAAIREMLDDIGIKYAWIAGEVRADERGEQVRRFQEEPECMVFVAQIQTAGLGITLHAADTAVFYSVDFNYANYEQARARIHRIGQKNNCTYIHIVCQNTIDEYVLGVLKEKKNIAREIVDDWERVFCRG